MCQACSRKVPPERAPGTCPDLPSEMCCSERIGVSTPHSSATSASAADGGSSRLTMLVRAPDWDAAIANPSRLPPIRK
eukprot:4688101-Prymnesium_polylepis.1